MDIVLPLFILLCVSHINLTVQITNAERGKPDRNVLVGEPGWINLLKILVVGFHLPGIKIGRIEKVVTIGHA